ncbi:hypothetical protein F8M41_019933 [Gigaspora margarita]|uniref:Uncharacterized protein n=1 Tax=Gigaspora margarita TaxID=4874 RepID=A0A8H4EK97_GIGMA|nr:hypothetical protein F8M41_019933 [Gigaspora margarita]
MANESDEKQPLFIKNYHTYIIIYEPQERLKNAYNYYESSLVCAHLTIFTGCLFIIKWCFLKIGIDKIMAYDIIPWQFLFPLCTYFAIVIGARTLSNYAVIFYFITSLLQIVYISYGLATEECMHVSSDVCKEIELTPSSKHFRPGFSIFFEKWIVLGVIDIISLSITVIVFVLLIFMWCKVKSSALKELKMHLEYVPAYEFKYRDCNELHEKFENELKEQEHTKNPFLAQNPHK